MQGGRGGFHPKELSWDLLEDESGDIHFSGAKMFDESR